MSFFWTVLLISGITHIKNKKKTKIGNIDRILALSLTTFDLIMGLYLLFIAIESFRNYQVMQETEVGPHGLSSKL